MKLLCSPVLVCLFLLPFMVSALPSGGRDDGDSSHDNDNYPDTQPDRRPESLQHQLGYIAFPAIVLIIIIVIATVLLLIMYKNRYNRLCCFEKCRTNAMRERQLAAYRAQAKAEIRMGEQHMIKKREDRLRKKEDEAAASRPPAYEAALTHEVVKDSQDTDSVEGLQVDTSPLLPQEQ